MDRIIILIIVVGGCYAFINHREQIDEFLNPEPVMEEQGGQASTSMLGVYYVTEGAMRRAVSSEVNKSGLWQTYLTNLAQGKTPKKPLLTFKTTAKEDKASVTVSLSIYSHVNGRNIFSQTETVGLPGTVYYTVYENPTGETGKKPDPLRIAYSQSKGKAIKKLMEDAKQQVPKWK